MVLNAIFNFKVLSYLQNRLVEKLRPNVEKILLSVIFVIEKTRTNRSIRIVLNQFAEFDACFKENGGLDLSVNRYIRQKVNLLLKKKRFL